jgi:hypothetical protein
MNKKSLLKSSRKILEEEQQKLHQLLDSEEEEPEIIFYKGSMDLLTNALNGLVDQVGEMASKICKDHVLTVDDLKTTIILLNQINEK